MIFIDNVTFSFEEKLKYICYCIYNPMYHAPVIIYENTTVSVLYRRIKTVHFLMIYGTMKVCKYIKISVTYLPVKCYAHRFHVSKNALNQVLGELPGLFGSQ